MKKENVNNIIKKLLKLYEKDRINTQKKNKYWYPLSMATYDVEEIVEVIDSLCQFKTTMWEKTEQFENEFAKYVGSNFAIMVNSGSSADLILSHLLKDKVNNKSKDTVIIPAVTWPTQIWSVINAGFKVKIVDVDPKSLNIDMNSLVEAIDGHTAAIFLVHLMGNPCNLKKINQIIKNSGQKIIIMEDCCEALGAKINNTHVGNFGIGGTFSFFFSHHITTMEGGMIVVNSEKLAKRARILRAHGWIRNSNFDNIYTDIDPRYTFVDIGFNLRPTEIQSSFGIHQLKKLPIFNNRRNILFNKIKYFIQKTDFLEIPIAHGEPSWLGIPFMVNKNAPFKRKDILFYLEKHGIETRPIVTGNIMKQPVASIVKLNYVGLLNGANEIHERGFYIGLSPIFDDNKIEKLIEILNNFFGKF